MKPITLIGGAAIDILSQSQSSKGQPGVSQKGLVKMQEGGSLRNTAECIARLGLTENLSFVTCIGDDEPGKMLLRSFANLKIVFFFDSGCWISDS
jgi:sugar/nucleoside kinase (ribokinase family)